MKAEQIIISIDSKYPNNYGSQDKLDWISEVERNIYTNIIEEYFEDIIPLVAIQDSYAMVGYVFEDIESVIINDIEYDKLSIKFNEIYSYYKKNNMLAINPIPAIDGTMTVVYKWKPLKITVDTMTDIDLILPEEFMKIYNFYVYHNICLLNKDFGEANNWTSMYNAAVEDLKEWYYKSRPNLARAKVNAKWRL